jgi:NAD+ synthase (glutamine-hydrolysing)
MPNLRLGAATLNQTPLAWEVNRRNIVAALDAARQEQVSVLCLPELAISGYGCEDMFLSPGVCATALELLADLLPVTYSLFTCLGLPIIHDGRVYNAVAVAGDGRLLGFVCKQYLAGDGIHYEPRWFHPWPAEHVDRFAWAGDMYPIGDLLFVHGGVGIGFEICRDAWGKERPAERLARRGADIILNPSASHFAFGKQAIREGFVERAAREFRVAFVYVNLLGNEAGRAIFDGGAMLADQGRIVARGPRFSFADAVLTYIDVLIEPRGVEPEQKSVVAASFALPELNGASARPAGFVSLAVDSRGEQTVRRLPGCPPGHPQWEVSSDLKREEFARAVPLALWDYLRKSRLHGFVVSLSGGADSSATALMVYQFVCLAAAELGVENFAERVASITGDAEPIPLGEPVERALVRRLLACVYQSTRNSGELTRAAAKSVADALGAQFYCWSVDGLVEDYVATVSLALGRELNWRRDDVALQNIQARARGPAAWLLANLRGALLLTTSNRSEAAVGYATMDGDTCGGLAPIAGIDKAFLLDWLRWMEQTGPVGLEPLAFLSVVNTQQPTAELRPPEADQTDEGDLMPYRVLDAIERAAIRDKKMPIEVFETVAPQFADVPTELLAVWVEKFFRLWCRNQWKRERYAPSFHVDDENLDPKTWCRFPILNGGYERELAQLRAHLNLRTDRPVESFPGEYR